MVKIHLDLIKNLLQEAAPVDPGVCSICSQGQKVEVKGETDLIVCSECNKGGKKI